MSMVSQGKHQHAGIACDNVAEAQRLPSLRVRIGMMENSRKSSLKLLGMV
jgi:hypothetical protein